MLLEYSKEVIKMSKYNTIEVWNKFYGNKTEVYDYAGRLMKKSDCGNPHSKFFPTIDHIRPLSKGGSDILAARLHSPAGRPHSGGASGIGRCGAV